jgi:hypothetical protein
VAVGRQRRLTATVTAVALRARSTTSVDAFGLDTTLAPVTATA